MKQNGIQVNHNMIDVLIDEMGDEHVSTSVETPLRPDAFALSDDEKIEQIAVHFGQIMDLLGLDRSDDSLSGTPKRVAKMYVKEIFSGLNPANFPDIKLFENKYQYNQMLVEKNILFYSNCEHHFVPIIGKAHVAYISSGKVIGLSKINRVVQHFQAPAGTRTPHHANHQCTQKSIGNRRCSSNHRRHTPLCFFQRRKRCE